MLITVRFQIELAGAWEDILWEDTVRRAGMKHSDVFRSLYIMSPCCLSARSAGSPDSEIAKTLEAVKTTSDLANLSFFARGSACHRCGLVSQSKESAALFELPTKGGELQSDVIAKWAANAPLAFVDQYLNSLRSYRGIAIDVGDQDGLRIDARKLHEILDAYGIANSFEVCQGTHTSKVADVFRTM